MPDPALLLNPNTLQIDADPEPDELERLMVTGIAPVVIPERELAESIFDEAKHPRWPHGTPRGGEFMRVGERFTKDGHTWEIAHVANGHIIANEASGDINKVETRVFAPNQIGDAKPAPIPVLKAGEGASYTGTSGIPVVDAEAKTDHDPSIHLPAESPLTPDEWKAFGQVDQHLYVELASRYGKWKQGQAKAMLKKAMDSYSASAQSAVRAAFSHQYSKGYGAAAGDFLSLQEVFDNGPSEQAKAIYREARELQGEIREINAWELMNRLRAPDVSVIHWGHGGSHNQNLVSGSAALKPGYSTSWSSSITQFGSHATAFAVAARHVLLATDVSKPPGAENYGGEHEFANGDRLKLNTGMAHTFKPSSLGSDLTKWFNDHFNKSSGSMRPGALIKAMFAHMKGESTALPLPPPPAGVVYENEGKKPLYHVPPPDVIKEAAAKAKDAGYAHGETPEEALKPIESLGLEPGDIIEGHNVGKRYLVIADPGHATGLAYVKLDGSGTVFHFGSMQSERRKLEATVKLPPPPAEAKLAPFHPEQWTQAGALQPLSKMQNGEKVALQGDHFEVTGQAAGHTLLKSLTSGLTAKANAGHLTAALGPKPGVDVEGYVPPAPPEPVKPAFTPKPGELALWLDKVVKLNAQQENGLWSITTPWGADTFAKAEQLSAFEPEFTPPLVPQKGDTFAFEGQRMVVTNTLKNGTVRARASVVGAKVQDFAPSHPALGSLFRPSEFTPGGKSKVGQMKPGQLVSGSPVKVRPYMVMGHTSVGTHLLNLDTGENVTVSKNKSWPLLVSKADAEKLADTTVQPAPKPTGDLAVKAMGAADDFMEGAGITDFDQKIKIANAAIHNFEHGDYPAGWSPPTKWAQAYTDALDGEGYGATIANDIFGAVKAALKEPEPTATPAGALSLKDAKQIIQDAASGLPYTADGPNGTVTITKHEGFVFSHPEHGMYEVPAEKQIAAIKTLRALVNGDMPGYPSWQSTVSQYKLGATAAPEPSGVPTSGLVPHHQLKAGHTIKLKPTGVEYEVLEDAQPGASTVKIKTVKKNVEYDWKHHGKSVIVTGYTPKAEPEPPPAVSTPTSAHSLEDAIDHGFAAFSSNAGPGNAYKHDKVGTLPIGEHFFDKSGKLWKVKNHDGADTIITDGQTNYSVAGKLRVKRAMHAKGGYTPIVDSAPPVGGPHDHVSKAAADQMTPNNVGLSLGELKPKAGDQFVVGGQAWTVKDSQPMEGFVAATNADTGQDGAFLASQVPDKFDVASWATGPWKGSTEPPAVSQQEHDDVQKAIDAALEHKKAIYKGHVITYDPSMGYFSVAGPEHDTTGLNTQEVGDFLHATLAPKPEPAAPAGKWASLNVGDTFTHDDMGGKMFKVTGDLGDKWEITHLTSGNKSQVLKTADAPITVTGHHPPAAPTVTGPEPSATTVGDLKVGDKFEIPSGYSGQGLEYEVVDTTPIEHPASGDLPAYTTITVKKPGSSETHEITTELAPEKVTPAGAPTGDEPLKIKPYGSAWASGGKAKYHKLSELAEGDQFKDKAGKTFTVHKHYADAQTPVTDVKDEDGHLFMVPHTFTDNGKTKPTRVKKVEATEPAAAAPSGLPTKMADLNVGDSYSFAGLHGTHYVEAKEGGKVKVAGEWFPEGTAFKEPVVSYTPASAAVQIVSGPGNEPTPVPPEPSAPEGFEALPTTMSPNHLGLAKGDQFIDGTGDTHTVTGHFNGNVETTWKKPNGTQYGPMTWTDDTMDAKAVKKAPVSAPEPPSSAPTPAGIFDYGPVKLSGGKAAGGSQGAQIMTGPVSQNAAGGVTNKWLLKTYGGDENRVATELLANAIYRKLGVKVANAGTTTANGKAALTYPLEDGSTTMFSTKYVPGGDEAKMKAMGEDYMADALLANHDFVGLEDDNALWNGDEPTRLDQGGTFFYRAMGEKKPFNAIPDDVWSMLAKGQGKRGVLVSESQMREQAAHIAATLTPEAIDQLVDQAPFQSHQLREHAREALKGRVAWMKDFGNGMYAVPDEVKAKLLPDAAPAGPQKDMNGEELHPGDAVNYDGYWDTTYNGPHPNHPDKPNMASLGDDETVAATHKITKLAAPVTPAGAPVKASDLLPGDKIQPLPGKSIQGNFNETWIVNGPSDDGQHWSLTNEDGWASTTIPKDDTTVQHVGYGTSAYPPSEADEVVPNPDDGTTGLSSEGEATGPEMPIAPYGSKWASGGLFTYPHVAELEHGEHFRDKAGSLFRVIGPAKYHAKDATWVKPMAGGPSIAIPHTFTDAKGKTKLTRVKKVDG